MAITISGENNNDRITAQDGVIDTISGFNISGIITASSFTGDLTGDVTGNITGNVTGNINNSTLLLQVGSTEKLRLNSDRVIIGQTLSNNQPTYNTSTTFVTTHTNNPGAWNAIAIISGNTTGASFLKFGDRDDEDVSQIGHYNDDNSLRFYTNGSVNERLRITSAGNVGIGSAIPSAKLDIAGGLMIKDSNALYKFEVSANSNESEIKSRASSGAYRNTAFLTNNFIVKNTATNSPQEKFRITSAGNVNIGGDYTQTTYKLRVSGTSYLGGVVRVPNGSAAAPAIHFGDSDSGVYGDASNGVRLTASGSDTIVATSNGVTFPIKATALTSFTLGSQSALSKPLYFADAASVESASILLDNSSQELRIKNGRFSGQITFTTYNTEALRINSSGTLEINQSGTNTNVLANDQGGPNIWLKNTSNTDGNYSKIGFFNSTGYITAFMAAQYQDAGDRNTDLVFGTRANGGNLLERLRIQSTGIVKVETSDSSSFNAHFLVNNSESNSGVSLIGSGSSFSAGGWAAVTDAGIIRSSANSSNGLVLQAASGDLQFYVEGNPPAERLRITSGGDTELRNIVSGVTNAYSQYLKFRTTQTNGQSAITGAIRAQGKSGWGGDLVFYSKPANGTPNDTVNERVRILSTGKIGINETDPEANVEINRGSEGKYLVIGGDDANNGRALQFTSSEGGTGSNGALHTINAKSGNGAIAFATNATERMRIDSDGYVTKPNTPAFFATLTSGSNSIIGTLTYNTSGNGYYNNGGHLNVSTGKFTAPVTGIYHFHFHGFFQVNQSTGYYEVIMRRTNANGGNATSVTRQYGSRQQPTNQYGPSISMQWTGPMTAGHTMEVRTAGQSFHGSNGYYFGGYLVG